MFKSTTAAIAVFFLTFQAFAQTTSFTYQGKLTDGALPASGTYDLTFKLFSDAGGATQVGSAIVRDDVPVSNGIFTVTLDFGSSPFTGSPSGDYLQISVRPGTSTGAYTPLAPLQPITSSPYAISTIRAQSAATADNANQLGGVDASQYVQTNDTRMTDQRDPTPGSTNYIQNQNAAVQPANFNINGTGSAGLFDAATQYNIGGNRFLSGTFSNGNSFVGYRAGQNPTGGFNTFVGKDSGFNNTTGFSNSFVGVSAGILNTTGVQNTFLGVGAGQNSSTGGNNTFLGFASGSSNTTGTQNTLVGNLANVASGNLTFATAIGANARVSTSNTVELGRSTDSVHVPGALNVDGTGSANIFNATTQYNIGGDRYLGGSNDNANTSNTFVGKYAGASNVGPSNLFAGYDAASQNTQGGQNTVLGVLSGLSNIVGSNNTFLGYLTALSSTGSNNTAVGSGADVVGNLTFATAIGSQARVSTSNTVELGRGADTVHVPGVFNATGGSNRFTGGSVYIGHPNSLIITDQNGGCWFITVNTSGQLGSIAVTCP